MTETAGLFGVVPQVPDALNHNSTAGECAPMQAVKQAVTLESFDHQEPLKMLFLSDKLWLIISVALLILL